MKIESLCTYYRGRTSFAEFMNMPLSYINALYNIAQERIKTEQAEKEKQKAEGKDPQLSPSEAMALEDEMEAALT